jgi:hypothetical protein
VLNIEFNQTTLNILYISHISQPYSFTGTTPIAYPLHTNCDPVHSLIYGASAANK